MDNIAVKAINGDDVRRFTMDGSAKFDDMVDEVNRRFNLTNKKVTLKFKDDEGEMCTFTSDEELAEAIRIARQSVPPILRVQIIVQVEVAEVEPAEEVRRQEPWQPNLITPGQAMMQAWQQACHFGPAAWHGVRAGWGKGQQPEMDWSKEDPQLDMDAGEAGEFAGFVPGGKRGGRGGGKKGQGKGKGVYVCEGDEEFAGFGGSKCGGRGGGKFKGGLPCGRGFGKAQWGKGSSEAHSARFVADVNVPDGALVVPGAEFTKTWRLRNDGELAWPPSAGLVFVKGDVLHKDPIQLVGEVAPGEETDISVTLTAPPVAGRFISYWRLSADAEAERDRWHQRLNVPFGQRVWAQIVVTPDGKCQLTGEEDSVPGNVRHAVRSIPSAVCSVVLPVLETAAGGVTTAVDKLDESTGLSEKINKFNDSLSAAQETIHNTAGAISDALAASPRDAALEVGSPTDVKHLGPEAALTMVLQQHGEPEAEKASILAPSMEAPVDESQEKNEGMVWVPKDPTEDLTEVPQLMTESLMADIANVNAAEMSQLKEMGFTDEARILQALELSGGDVILAVEALSEP
jgi:hypothetical protein